MPITSRQKSGNALRPNSYTTSDRTNSGFRAGKVLQLLAKWHGADPDEVSVTPNLNFTDDQLNGQGLVQLMQAKGLGAPISDESIHNWMNKQGVTDLDFEEEVDKINNEEPALGIGIEGVEDDDGE